MAEKVSDAVVRFHMSLNVSNLDRSVAFYKALFGIEPAKCRPDYAKFEPDVPPLVLSLEPSPSRPGGTLNHAGLRLPDSAALVEVQRRLESAGIHTQREEGVECCYARQTKFWVHDPDRTLWEIYNLHEDIEHRGAGQAAEVLRDAPTLPASAPIATVAPPPTNVWSDRMGGSIAQTADLMAGSLDEVRLQGTFNVPLSAERRAESLGDLFRALVPGGSIHLHNLVADRELVGSPNLPGPAAVVQAVPTLTEILAAFEGAGFTELTLEHFDSAPCFTRQDAQMRQLKLRAVKPAEAPATVDVLYRGPLRAIEDDLGNRYPRGERVRVSASAAKTLPKDAMLVFGDAGPLHDCGV